jgi:hypothetical protein
VKFPRIAFFKISHANTELIYWIISVGLLQIIIIAGLIFRLVGKI